jgi:methylmalonyl-CoA/ethylmalonyl-CoA epimerase
MRPNMKILKLDHIGIAIKNADEVLKLYEGVFGMEASGEEINEEQKAKTFFLPVGDTEIELLISTAPDGPIARFIDAKGEGVQHIAFLVDDLEAALRELAAKGIRLIDEKPRNGAGGKWIAFLHPKSTYGVLVELCEHKHKK